MAGWWETQLQGAPGWLALRGDVIAGCTRLIDWPCCSVARDDGLEARSCTAATASCSLLLLPLSLLLWLFYTSLPLLWFCLSSMLLWICLSSGSFVYFFCSFSTLSTESFFSLLSLSLSVCLSLFVAGFSRLVVVCWGCCTTFCPRMLLSVFWRGEKPWISGLSPAKHKPGMTPTYIFIHILCIHSRAEMLLRSKKWKWIQLEKQEKRGCAFAHTPTPSDLFRQIRNPVLCLLCFLPLLFSSLSGFPSCFIVCSTLISPTCVLLMTSLLYI